MERDKFLEILPDLAVNYIPSAEVLTKIGRVNLLMLIGPTGSGKTTLINRLAVPYVKTDTTRSPRPEEKDGIDYFFRQDYEKVADDIKNGRFVQIAVGAEGDLYATKASSYPEAGWAVMAVMADVIPIFRNLGFATTASAFITPPNFNEWQRRIGEHNLSPDKLKKRLAEAERSFRFALSDADTHFILNDDLLAATEQIENLMRNRTDSTRESKARLAAESIQTKINLDNL